MSRALPLIALLAGMTPVGVAFGADQKPPGTIEQRLERVERQARLIAELQLEIQTLKRENRELLGRIEEQEFAMEALKRKQRDLYLDVDERLSRIGTPAPGTGSGAGPGTDLGTTPGSSTGAVATPPAGAAPVVNGTGTATGTGTAAVGGGDPAKEEAAYQAAKDMLLKEPRRYQEAKVAFREFLAKYPASDKAPRAQYWLAEASYVVGDNSTALADYQQILDRYPDSDMVPGALLKLGFIHQANGRHDEARQAFERVVRDYPDSLPAPKARERLDRLAREGR